MKKLFSLLTMLMLGISISSWAQETSIRGEDSQPQVYKEEAVADEIVGPYRAPQSTYSFFEEPTYIRLDLQSGSNFKIRYGGQTVGVIGSFNPVTLYSSTDIRGTFSFNSSYSTNCNNQSNFYTLAQRSGSNNWYADNIHGTFTITSTGTTDSDGDQVYLVTLNGTLHSTMRYESCGAYPIYHSKQLAIVAYNSGTKYTLKNSTVISTSATNGTVSGGGTYYDVNQNITLTPNPNTGYHFVNWNGGNTQNPRTVQVGHNDVTYTANFAINTYTVVFNANGGTGSMSNQAFTYGTAQNLTSNTTSITRSGYTFGGWATTAQRANDGIVDYTNGQSVNNLTTTHNGTVNLYAVWNEIPVTPFTLILDANAHGTVSVYDITKGKYVNFTDNEAEVGEGHEIRITATPDAGYHVATLTFADEPFESGGEFEMSDDGLAIVARFDLDVYDITYKDKGNGNFTGTHGANHPTTHTYGTATPLVNPTKSGATFLGWYTSSDCSGDAITSLGATAYTEGPITLYAKWANNGTITANASLPAGGSVIVNQPSTAGGTAVTLTVEVNEGYTFTGWADGGDDNPRTVYVDGDHTYTAQFVEGININVQSFLFRDNAASSGWFNFQGITVGYQFVFYVNNSSVVGNYTQAHLDSDNKIYDHGTELSITTASFSVTADANNYYLDGQFVCSNGKRYIIHTWHEKPYGPFTNDYGSGNYDGTSFSSITSNNLQGDGSYLVKANAGNSSGMSYAYQTEIDFIIDSEKQHGSEKIPSGFYFINHSGAAGTVKATNAIGYLDLNYYNDYDDIGGSYVRETYHQSGGNIGNLWIWTLNDGYARVTNVNEQYYIIVRARNSYKYTAYYTIGSTAPFDVDITGDANGSVDIAYYASNWGTTVHYEEGVNEFFSGNTLTLTPEAKPGYEFWRWSDESSSVENSAYGASRNVTISGNLTLQAIFRAAAVTHNVSITAPENGTITVAYNDGSDQSFTSGSRDIEEGTVLTVTTTPAADYHFNAWTGNGAASVTVDADKTIGATFAQNDYFLNATCGAGGASVTRSDNGNNLTVKRAGNTVTLTPTAANGYEFLSWSGADAAKISNNIFTFPTNGTHNTTYNVQANFQATTYNLTYNGLEGATHSNPATYTIETATFDLAAPGTREGYTFTGWTCGDEAITQIAVGSTGDKTITANWSQNTYTVSVVSNNEDYGTVDVESVASVPYGTTITTSTNTINVNGTTVTATPTAATAEYTYAFTDWTNGTATVTGALTVTANFSRTPNSYTLTWTTDGDALTGDYTTGTVAYGTTIAQPNTPTKTGYTFAGWTPDVAETMPAANTTYTATWTQDVVNITLNDNDTKANYDALHDYNTRKANVTYSRVFTEAGRWSTLTLPFAVTPSLERTNKLWGCVYEFKYAEGMADVGEGLTLYFSRATSMEAGKCYIVNPNAALVERSKKGAFVFGGVEMDLSADIVDDLTQTDAYDGLNYYGSGDIVLVGTLRNGTLTSSTPKKYMGLKQNKIYYTNSTAVRAYRGVFRFINNIPSIAPRVRIVVDGEDMGELEVVDGELYNADGDRQAYRAPIRKFIRDGVLYIERDGVIYDAQGKRAE